MSVIAIFDSWSKLDAKRMIKTKRIFEGMTATALRAKLPYGNGVHGLSSKLEQDI